MDRGAWQVTVPKCQTQLSDYTTTTIILYTHTSHTHHTHTHTAHTHTEHTHTSHTHTQHTHTSHTHTAHTHTHTPHAYLLFFSSYIPYCPLEMSPQISTLSHPTKLGIHRVPGLLTSCPLYPCPLTPSSPQSDWEATRPGPWSQGPV